MFNPEKPPEISASRWLNSPEKRSLRSERGKVIFVALAQIVCPGSIKHGLPQAERIRRAFTQDAVTVYGLNMAFEKDSEQTLTDVEKFIAAAGYSFPVAYDKPVPGGLPETMQAYELQGTPAILLFDRQGRLRRHYLGAVDDLRLGAEIMALVMEDKDAPRNMSIAVETCLAAALTNPGHDDHEHGEGCGCGHDHGHNHEPGHDSGHDSGHEHGHPGHVHGPDCNH